MYSEKSEVCICMYNCKFMHSASKQIFSIYQYFFLIHNWYWRLKMLKKLQVLSFFKQQKKKSWIQDMRKDNIENIGPNRFSPCLTGWNTYEFTYMWRYQGDHIRVEVSSAVNEPGTTYLNKESNLRNDGNVLNAEGGRGKQRWNNNWDFFQDIPSQ